MKRLEVPAIVAVWAAAIAFIQPYRDFPIHDDWDFAIATWRFAETGHFYFTQFTVVSLRALVLWGALWTRLFGQSFNVLTASTLVLSAATLVVVNRTLARANVPLFGRLVATFALLLHPIFLWASCTYMSDVPFVFVSAVAIYFFTRGVEEERLPFVIAGCAAIVVATFIRQTGIVILAAPFLAAWLQGKRRLLAPLVATGVLFIGVWTVHRDWLSGQPAMFAVHYHMWGESTFRLPQQARVILDYVLFNSQNSAMMFLPLSLPLLFLRPRFSRRMWIVAGVVFLLIAGRAAVLAADGYLLPYSGNDPSSNIMRGNIVFDWGVGPPLLLDTFNQGHPYPFRLAVWARALLTALSAIVAVALLLAVTRSRSVAAIAAMVGTAALFASGFYYDRYSLDSAWSVVLVLPMLIPWQQRTARVTSIVALLLVAAFSLFAVREHFAWQHARWRAWSDLRAQGVAINRIDGGAELYAFYELADAPRKVGRRGHPPREFVLAFRSLPGYGVIGRYPFGWRGGEIKVLRKINASAP